MRKKKKDKNKYKNNNKSEEVSFVKMSKFRKKRIETDIKKL